MFRLSVGLVTIAGLAAGAYVSLRLAWADFRFRENTLASVAEAVRLDPANARYLAWLAELREYAGQDPASTLSAAIELSPRDSSLWIRRGLRAEIDGDPAAAERHLLQAARIDRLYQPRWTLANFYFRHNRRDAVWRWARDAFAIGDGDLNPLFALCLRAGNPNQVLRVLPQRPAVLAKYVAYLMAGNDLDAAATAAQKLIESARVEDRTTLLALVDRLVDRQAVDSAVSLWKALMPGQSALLTNPDFAAAPIDRGFDWRLPATHEVTVVRETDGAKVLLSGSQPERCELLWQMIPLASGARYEFRFRFQTSGLRAPSGVRWLIVDHAGVPLAESPDLSASQWTNQSLQFTAPAARLARLVLMYQRVPGTARTEGAVALRDMDIRLAE